MTSAVYQIYFDPHQKNVLSPLTIPYLNTVLTPFFENDVIVKLYNEKKIDEVDYFGVLSWRIEAKNNLSLNLLNQINSHDMYSFKNIVQHHPVFPTAQRYHPEFEKLFKEICDFLKLDYFKLKNEIHLGLYQNAIIARKEIFIEYLNTFLLPVMNFITTNPDVHFQARLKSDPRYSSYPHGMRLKLQNAFGTPYYQYHTFLCERLWSVYYHINKHRLSLKTL